MKTLLLLLAFTLGISPEPRDPVGACPGGELATARTADSLDQALRSVRRMAVKGIVTDPEEINRAEKALGDLDRAWGRREDRREEIQLALLDFLGRSIRISEQVPSRGEAFDRPPAFGLHSEEDLLRRAAAILRRRLPQIRKWLTRNVLLLDRIHPADRRVAACSVLAIDENPETVLALFAGTRSNPREVRDAAIAALGGRDLPEVHRRLVEILSQADRGEIAVWRSGLERHFAAMTLSPDDTETVNRVREYVEEAISAEDWRRASRGVAVARCLPHSAAFPALIAGLEEWASRDDGVRPVRRVLGEIEAELRRRSGRSLGLDPRRWTMLWEGYRKGDVALQGHEGGDRSNITRAAFFGLHPVTDRVVFVLDRSGSMETEFGSSDGHSRLKEAVAQLVAFLEQLGPRTRFSVVVFSDTAGTWRSRLQPATPTNVQTAGTWVLHAGAKGGTQLRSGVLAAMHINRQGLVDLEALEADTVIVLCDGATAEGPSWVEPLLRKVNDEARMVFHAVQIGTGGDGTLEALCELTGGDFVQVDG